MYLAKALPRAREYHVHRAERLVAHPEIGRNRSTDQMLSMAIWGNGMLAQRAETPNRRILLLQQENNNLRSLLGLASWLRKIAN